MTATAGARITGEARAQMAQLVARRYLAGEAIRPIALDLGRSYGFVQQLLVEAEVPPRGRGGDTRSPAAKARLEQTAARVAEVIAEHLAEAPVTASKKKSKAKKSKKTSSSVTKTSSAKKPKKAKAAKDQKAARNQKAVPGAKGGKKHKLDGKGGKASKGS